MIRQYQDLDRIATRICTGNECFVLEREGLLSVAFIHPVDLETFLDWREELIEELDESEQHARESRTRSAGALLPKVRPTPSFERQLQKYKRSHPDVIPVYEGMRRVLADDPYNLSGEHPITPLSAFKRGCYRYRKRRWRFRYSIHDGVVWLNCCKLRRENTYSGRARGQR